MSEFNQTIQVDGKALRDIFFIHARALACHCECLGMNAENSMAICDGKRVPYSNDSYSAVMQKWGLIDEEGKPSI